MLLPSRDNGVGMYMGKDAFVDKVALTVRKEDTHRVRYDRTDVASQIRTTLLAWGLGKTNPDAPLQDIINKDSTVIVKPNWVNHFNASGSGMSCVVTHPEFVLASLAEVLACRPSRLVLGDAPIQSCDLGQLLDPSFKTRLKELGTRYGTEIELVDFRRTIVPSGGLSQGQVFEQKAESMFVRFDLGADSLLEPITEPGRFRVNDYHPDALNVTHGPGRHQYLLWRQAFEFDTVLSLPKLKTHCKAGITAAIKNLVGFNGSKEFLPHHRRGGSASGGDNFEGSNPIKHLSEWFTERASRNIGQQSYQLWRHLGRVARGLAGGRSHHMGGAWHGNDTCWRMAVDLNRILVYGLADGSMADTPMRAVYSLTDAIICGQGDGPLTPYPHFVGAVTFASSSPAADYVHAHLLGLDSHKLPIIEGAVDSFRWPLASPTHRPHVLMAGHELTGPEIYRKWGSDARPPRGWIGHVEMSDRE